MDTYNSPLKITRNTNLSKKFPAKEKHPSLSLLTIIQLIERTDTRLIALNEMNEQLDISTLTSIHEHIKVGTEARIKDTLTLQTAIYYERSDLLILKLNCLEGYYVVNLSSLKWSYFHKKKSAKAAERLVYKGLLPEGLNELFLRKLSIIAPEGILKEKTQKAIRRVNYSDIK